MENIKERTEQESENWKKCVADMAEDFSRSIAELSEAQRTDRMMTREALIYFLGRLDAVGKSVRNLQRGEQ